MSSYRRFIMKLLIYSILIVLQITLAFPSLMAQKTGKDAASTSGFRTVEQDAFTVG